MGDQWEEQSPVDPYDVIRRPDGYVNIVTNITVPNNDNYVTFGVGVLPSLFDDAPEDAVKMYVDNLVEGLVDAGVLDEPIDFRVEIIG